MFQISSFIHRVRNIFLLSYIEQSIPKALHTFNTYIIYAWHCWKPQKNKAIIPSPFINFDPIFAQIRPNDAGGGAISRISKNSAL